METYIEKPTQEQKILKYLKANKGKWISGRYFNNVMRISQFHARIWSLQKKGHEIIPSDFKDEFGFKSYMIK